MADKNEFIEFTGRIEAHTRKAILFLGDNWAEAEWVPLESKFGPIVEIKELDHETKEARIGIQRWIVDKNGWR